MKDYELINYLKHKVMEAERKHSKWQAFVGQAEENLKNFITYTEEQKKSFLEELKNCEDTKAQTYDFLQVAEKALKEAESQIDAKREKKVRAPKKKPIPTPIEPTPEEQFEVIKQVKEQVNNKFRELSEGKERCPECGVLFTKGGAFYNHYKSHFSGE